jgi:IS5 family transposase
VDFEQFRPDLEKALAYSDRSKGGRPPFDPVLMFKVLVIQTINSLSDERTEYLINDRFSFMRFLGLGLSDRVPDAKTIWLLRERLTKAGAVETLFARFDAMLRERGYIPMSGQIVDASLVAAPRQRNTNAEKADVRAGQVPVHWKDKPAKLSHKNRDARWTLKFSKPLLSFAERAKPREDGSVSAMDLAIPAFGDKNHISIDRRFRLIRRWKATTDASAYDGARLREGLLDPSNIGSAVWADTTYRSAANEHFMERHGFVSKVHHKKPPHRDMPTRTKRSNAGKSVIRSRVEHVFADQKSRMGQFVRTVGIRRAEMKIGLANLFYNIRRYLYLERIKAT